MPARGARAPAPRLRRQRTRTRPCLLPRLPPPITPHPRPHRSPPAERPYRPPSLDGHTTYGVYLRFAPGGDTLHAATAATSLAAADQRARERVAELTGRGRDPLPFCEARLVRFDAPATIPSRLSLEALRAGHLGGRLVG